MLFSLHFAYLRWPCHSYRTHWRTPWRTSSWPCHAESAACQCRWTWTRHCDWRPHFGWARRERDARTARLGRARTASLAPPPCSWAGVQVWLRLWGTCGTPGHAFARTSQLSRRPAVGWARTGSDPRCRASFARSWTYQSSVCSRLAIVTCSSRYRPRLRPRFGPHLIIKDFRFKPSFKELKLKI